MIRNAARALLLCLSLSSSSGAFESPLFPGLDLNISCSRILHNGFSDVCYSCAEKTPLVAIYIIKGEDVEGKVPKGRPSFRPDYRLPVKCRSYPKDYAGTGYDRGHLLPAGVFHDAKRRKKTFLMSNVAPQKPSMNRGVWSKIERYVRIMAIRHGEVRVATGVCFDEASAKVRHGVAVPDRWFKIVGIPGRKEPVVFVVPNRKLSKAKLKDYILEIGGMRQVSSIIHLSK